MTIRKLLVGSVNAGIVSLACSLSISSAIAQQPSNQRNQNEQNQTQNQQPKQANNNQQYAVDESPALGLVVGSCPGDAVCVMDTVWGSPADDAGIRNGDYLLAINGKKLSSPQQLRQLLSKMQSGEQVTVRLWRGGQEFEKQGTWNHGPTDATSKRSTTTS